MARKDMRMRAWIWSLMTLAATGCAGPFGTAAQTSPSGATGIPAARIGLFAAAVDSVLAPEPVRDNAIEPGESALLPRANPVTPPAIPHLVGEFLPITRDDNACLDCHAVTQNVPGEPTPIPASHYLDLRNAPDRPRGQIAGARQVCTSCHVPQTSAAPLVANPP